MKIASHLSRDEVEAVKETAHVRIGVFGLHHAGHLFSVNDDGLLLCFYLYLLFVSGFMKHLVAVEGGSKSSSTDPRQEKLTDGLGSNHLLRLININHLLETDRH